MSREQGFKATYWNLFSCKSDSIITTLHPYQHLQDFHLLISWLLKFKLFSLFYWNLNLISVDSSREVMKTWNKIFLSQYSRRFSIFTKMSFQSVTQQVISNGIKLLCFPASGTNIHGCSSSSELSCSIYPNVNKWMDSFV